MSETPTPPIEETPIDEECFASICEKTGRGIYIKILHLLDNVWEYDRTDEKLRQLWRIYNTSPVVLGIGKTYLEVIEAYLKEKGKL